MGSSQSKADKNDDLDFSVKTTFSPNTKTDSKAMYVSLCDKVSDEYFSDLVDSLSSLSDIIQYTFIFTKPIPSKDVKLPSNFQYYEKELSLFNEKSEKKPRPTTSDVTDKNISPGSQGGGVVENIPSGQVMIDGTVRATKSKRGVLQEEHTVADPKDVKSVTTMTDGSTFEPKKLFVSMISSHMDSFEEDTSKEFYVIKLNRGINNSKNVVLIIAQNNDLLESSDVYYDYIYDLKGGKLLSHPENSLNVVDESFQVFSKSRKVYQLPKTPTAITKLSKLQISSEASEEFYHFVFYDSKSLSKMVNHVYSVIQQRNSCFVYQASKLTNGYASNYFKTFVEYMLNKLSMDYQWVKVKKNLFLVISQESVNNSIVTFNSSKLSLIYEFYKNADFGLAYDPKLTLRSSSILRGVTNRNYLFGVEDFYGVLFNKLPVFEWNYSLNFDFIFILLNHSQTKMLIMMLNELADFAGKEFLIHHPKSSNLNIELFEAIKSKKKFDYTRLSDNSYLFHSLNVKNDDNSIFSDCYYRVKYGDGLGSDSIGLNDFVLNTYNLNISTLVNGVTPFKASPILRPYWRTTTVFTGRKSICVVPSSMKPEGLNIFCAPLANSDNMWTFLKDLRYIKKFSNFIMIVGNKRLIYNYTTLTSSEFRYVRFKDYTAIYYLATSLTADFADNSIIVTGYGNHKNIKINIGGAFEQEAHINISFDTFPDPDYVDLYDKTHHNIYYKLADFGFLNFEPDQSILGAPLGTFGISVRSETSSLILFNSFWLNRFSLENMRHVLIVRDIRGRNFQEFRDYIYGYMDTNADSTNLSVFIINDPKVENFGLEENEKIPYHGPILKILGKNEEIVFHVYHLISKKPGTTFESETCTLKTTYSNSQYSSPIEFFFGEDSRFSQDSKNKSDNIIVHINKKNKRNYHILAPIDIDHSYYDTISDLPQEFFQFTLKSFLLIESSIDPENISGKPQKATDSSIKRRFNRSFHNVFPLNNHYDVFNNMLVNYQTLCMILAGSKYSSLSACEGFIFLRLTEKTILFENLSESINNFLKIVSPAKALKAKLYHKYGTNTLIISTCDFTVSFENNQISIKGAPYGIYQSIPTKIPDSKISFVLDETDFYITSKYSRKTTIKSNPAQDQKYEIIRQVLNRDIDMENTKLIDITSGLSIFRFIFSFILLFDVSDVELDNLRQFMEGIKKQHLPVIFISTLDREAPSSNGLCMTSFRNVCVIAPSYIKVEMKRMVHVSSYVYVRLDCKENGFFFKCGVWSVLEKYDKPLLENQNIDFMILPDGGDYGTEYYGKIKVHMNTRVNMLGNKYTHIKANGIVFPALNYFKNNIAKEIIFNLPIQENDSALVKNVPPNQPLVVWGFVKKSDRENETSFLEIAAFYTSRQSNVIFSFIPLFEDQNKLLNFDIDLGLYKIKTKNLQHIVDKLFVYSEYITDITSDYIIGVYNENKYSICRNKKNIYPTDTINILKYNPISDKFEPPIRELEVKRSRALNILVGLNVYALPKYDQHI